MRLTNQPASRMATASACPRISELEKITSRNSGSYFYDFMNRNAANPIRHKVFQDLESDLQTLDDAAWAHIKIEISNIASNSGARGWQQLHDRLNEIKGYRYLHSIGCNNIKFIKRTDAPTPDLEAEKDGLVLCEVKTLNISDDEAERRYKVVNGESQLSNVSDIFSLEFIEGKFRNTISAASRQLLGHRTSEAGHRIVLFIINDDDLLHEYIERKLSQLQDWLNQNKFPMIDVKIMAKPSSYYSSA